jgi:hypothetical protein
MPRDDKLALQLIISTYICCAEYNDAPDTMGDAIEECPLAGIPPYALEACELLEGISQGNAQCLLVAIANQLSQLG